VSTTKFTFYGDTELLGLRQTKLPEFEHSYVALSKTPGMLFVDKTKYIERLDANERYRYLFLRPRQFGKSTFLSMLCSYYDIAQAATFENAFGGLYICSNPTPSRSRHLVLLLDLSAISINGDPTAKETSFNTSINSVLRDFLEKYWGRIGDKKSDIQDIICSGDASVSLMEVLVRIRWCKCLKTDFLTGHLEKSQEGRLYLVCWD